MNWVLISVLALEGLIIETTTPRALCPAVSLVEAALSERMSFVEGHDARWRLVLENAHRTGPPPADLLRVQLKDQFGNLRLEQVLDVTGASCDVRAETVAIVIAEYFESAQLESSPKSLPPNTPPKAASAEEPLERPTEAPARVPDHPKTFAEFPSAAPSNAERPNNAAQPESPAKTPLPQPPSLSLGLGLSIADWNSPGFSGRAAVHLSGSLRASLLAVALSTKQQTLASNGTADAWALPLRFAAIWTAIEGGVGWWLGPEALISYEQAKSSGIAISKSNHRFVWGLGAQAGARYPAESSWSGYLVGALDYALPLAASRFEIDGQQVLEAGPIRWTAALGIERDFF